MSLEAEESYGDRPNNDDTTIDPQSIYERLCEGERVEGLGGSADRGDRHPDRLDLCRRLGKARPQQLGVIGRGISGFYNPAILQN